jgi:porin
MSKRIVIDGLKCRLGLLLMMASMAFATGPSAAAEAQSASDTLSGPDATRMLLKLDDEAKDALLDVDWQQAFDRWKADLKERTGFDFGIDYNALGYLASSSLGDESAASGTFRVFGAWNLVGRGGPNNGGLVFKIENRHAYGDVPLTSFGDELGYAGLVSSVFSDQGWRATNLFWQQHFAQGRGVAYAGWLDVSDFVDVFALASPWRGFSNLAFQTGSGTIGGLPDGALGAMAGGLLTDNIFAAASIVDANADATDLFGGFDTLFDEGETFKTLELGWTSGADVLFINNAHVTVWQIDARSAVGTPDGHGVAVSYTQAVGGTWLPFIRGGWADAGGSLYEAAVSVGFGYTQDPGRSLMAVGLNWSRPNENTFGAKLDDQLTLEIFRRWQLTEGVEMTPSIQVIQDPALNPEENTIVLFGVRLRAAF